MEDRKGLVKISEMAALNGISRQTLILYDKNGLLKPAYVSESGYRYYSIGQIPQLRLICLLKQMGVSLAQIGAFMRDRSVDGVIELLLQREDAIQSQIERLQEQLSEVRQLSELFSHSATKARSVNLPRVEWLPQRKAIFSPYPEGEMDVMKLHLALMGAWGKLLDAGMLPSMGFGSVLRAASQGTPNPLDGAGSIVLVPNGQDVPGATMVTLPEGEYVTMYKVAMPYDWEPVRKLLDWMGERGLVPCGDVFDLCVLDSAFYNEEHHADLCRLEIPVLPEG